VSIRSFVTCGVAAAVAVACGSSVQYNSDYDPTADFSNISTYQWAQRTPSGDDDPRVYNDITMRKIKFAVNQALQAKGMQLANANPDVLVAWHGAINGKMSLQTVSSNYGYGYGWYGYGGMGMGTSTTYVNEWDEGTLLVDIIEGSKRELIWRGSAQAELKQRQDPQEGQEYLNDVVAKMLAGFPPYDDSADDS
jgi:hypothetical protein